MIYPKINSNYSNEITGTVRRINSLKIQIKEKKWVPIVLLSIVPLKIYLLFS